MGVSPRLHAYPKQIRADLARLIGDCDWQAKGEYARRCATQRPALNVTRALSHLARLFTPEVVCDLVEGGHFGVVDTLFFEGWWPWSPQFLHLGLDLADCASWEDHNELVVRLRSVNEHDGARFEIALWAGGVRSGLEVQYQDPGPTPRCDLKYVDGTTEYDVEAKAVDMAPSARNSSLLDRAVSLCLRGLHHRVGNGFKLLVFPDASLVRAARAESPRDFDHRLRGPTNALRSWLRVALTPLALGVQARVEGLGEVRLVEADTELVQFEVVGTPRTDFYQEVARALRPARHANHQLANSNATRIVAVWTGSARCPANEAAEVARILVAKQERQFTNVDWIALVNSHTMFGDWLTSLVAIPVRPQTSTFPPLIKTALTNWRRSS